MRFEHRAWLRVLVLLSLLTVLTPLGGRVAVAQGVGASTIDGGADWQYSPEASSSAGAAMVHRSLPDTWVFYMEEPLASLPEQDTAYLMTEVALPRFRDAFGVTEISRLAQGNAVSTLWHLYELPSPAGTQLALFAVDLTEVPGMGSIVILVSPKLTFAEALRSAEASVTVNDWETLLAVVPTTAILNAAGLPSTSAATTQPAGQGQAQATIPAGGGQQGASQTVGASTVTYSADWAADPNASASGTANQITLTHQTLANTSYTYIESPWVQNQIPDNAASMESLVTAMFSQVGIAPAPPVLTGNLADGTLWHLYSGAVGGQPYGMLFTVDTADPSRMNVDSMLFSPANAFAQALGAVQQGVTVNGASPLAGIDAAQAGTALQGGAPVTQPGTTPATGTTPAATAPAIGVTPTAAAGGQSKTVAGATITYNEGWIFDTVNSEPDAGTFWDRADGSGTWFGYLPAAPTSGDAAAQLADFNAQFFQSGFQTSRQLALEPLSPTSAWSLTTAELSGVPAAVLTYADTAVSGQRRIQVLLGDPATLPASLTDVQQSIQIDGVGVFSGVDPARVTSLLGGAPVGPGATTPASGQVPGVTPTATAAQPGGSLTQSTTVGQDTVAYGGGWQYSQANSSADVAFFTSPADSSVVFAHLSAPNNIGADPLTAVRGAADAFFQDFGAQNVQEVVAEVLPSGRSWGLFAFDRNGVPGALLLEADVTTAGLVRAQFLIGPRDQFSTHVASAQQSFQINGAGAFSDLDASRVASLLGGAPAGQTVPAGQTTPTPAAQGGGSVASYQAQDAPTGCDAIGWVMTDPGQLPVGQADLDHRSSCVGGATYAATCGTYVVSDTGSEIQCTVNVAVGTAPMAVASQQFTLVDAAGNRYPVDMETTVMMVMLLGAPELPEGTVDAGTTAHGTVMFNVPSTAPTPWVIEVAPDTLATTGGAPGTLVIDGPLQDFKVFGQ